MAQAEGQDKSNEKQRHAADDAGASRACATSAAVAHFRHRRSRSPRIHGHDGDGQRTQQNRATATSNMAAWRAPILQPSGESRSAIHANQVSMTVRLDRSSCDRAQLNFIYGSGLTLSLRKQLSNARSLWTLPALEQARDCRPSVSKTSSSNSDKNGAAGNRTRRRPTG